MTCLSIVQSGLPAVVVANPIFPLSTDENGIVFEVFEDAAAALQPFVGRAAFYLIDGTFISARLQSLTRCSSTHPALSLMRDRPTLRGMLEKFDERASSSKQ